MPQLVNGDFSDGLNYWTWSQSESGAGSGAVLVLAGQAVMLEGDSFLVTLQQTFVIPTGADVLSFDLWFTPPEADGFDRSDDWIPDAFEVHLLDAENNSVVPTWDPLATSFFNVQEDGTVYLGSDTIWNGQTATVDTSGVAPGTMVTLYFDFIGADDDTAGGVVLDNVSAACGSNCPLPPTLDPSGFDKCRFLSFEVAGEFPAVETAIRVWMDSLHHVNPPYTGGPSVPFTAMEGQSRWVGPPTQYLESTATGIPFYASRLQCTPHYQDWSTVGLLHATGSAVTPSSIYRVEHVSAVCLGSESTCAAVSAPLEIGTTRWGDITDPYNPPSPTVQPDVTDIGALVNKFRSAPGAPIKARAMLAGAPGNAFGEITHEVLNVDFAFSHISACVDAFRGVPYPYAIEPCP